MIGFKKESRSLGFLGPGRIASCSKHSLVYLKKKKRGGKKKKRIV
jgi:hypothetical protein